ncbi:uncharacterized protein PV09_09853, partial [Verruconis gallopava]
ILEISLAEPRRSLDAVYAVSVIIGRIAVSSPRDHQIESLKYEQKYVARMTQTQLLRIHFDRDILGPPDGWENDVYYRRGRKSALLGNYLALRQAIGDRPSTQQLAELPPDILENEY